MNGKEVARDIMVRDLVKLHPQMDLFEAIDLLVRHEISGAPVVDEENRLLGVFTEKDCLRVLVNATYEQLPTTRIHAFLEKDPQTITEDTDLLTIAQLFLSHPFRRLPVVQNGTLVGQVSRRDVLKAVNAVKDSRKDLPHAQLLYLSSLVPIEEPPIG